MTHSKPSIIRRTDSLSALGATFSLALEPTVDSEGCRDDLANAVPPDQAIGIAIRKLSPPMQQPYEHLLILQIDSSKVGLHRLKKKQRQSGITYGEVGLHLPARRIYAKQSFTTVCHHPSPTKSKRHLQLAIIVQISNLPSIPVHNKEPLQQWMIAPHDSIEKDCAIQHIYTS